MLQLWEALPVIQPEVQFLQACRKVKALQAINRQLQQCQLCTRASTQQCLQLPAGRLCGDYAQALQLG
jgi:hypothetical protein